MNAFKLQFTCALCLCVVFIIPFKTSSISKLSTIYFPFCIIFLSFNRCFFCVYNFLKLVKSCMFFVCKSTRFAFILFGPIFFILLLNIFHSLLFFRAVSRSKYLSTKESSTRTEFKREVHFCNNYVWVQNNWIRIVHKVYNKKGRENLKVHCYKNW